MRRIWTTGLMVLAALLAGPGDGWTMRTPLEKPGPPDLPGLTIGAFVRLSAREFRELTGVRLTLKDQVSFTVLKWKMKKAAKKNPEMTVSQYMASEKKKDLTILLIVAIAVIIVIAVVIARSVGPGPIGWGEGG